MEELESGKGPAVDSGKKIEAAPAATNETPLDAITGKLAGEMSKPTDAAPAVGSDSKADELVDADGRGFDPDLHVTDEFGQPLKNKRGLLRKRPGRKKSKATAGPVHSHVGPKPAEPPEEFGPDLDGRARLNAQITGRAAAGMFLTAAMMAGGDEWQPRKQNGVDERQVLDQAFEEYCIAKGVTDLPPGVALVTALAMYAAPRFTMPKTQSRLERFGLWLRRKFKRKGKHHGALANPRNDGERQDDARKKAGA